MKSTAYPPALIDALAIAAQWIDPIRLPFAPMPTYVVLTNSRLLEIHFLQLDFIVTNQV